MIYNYKRGKNPVVQWAKGVSFLNRKIVFKPGVNVVVGSNGTGKSALLTSLKTLFLAKQQGYTKMNGMTDLGELYRRGEFSDRIEHNGCPLLCDVTYDTGYFDDDNFGASFASINAQKRSSTGQSSRYHLGLVKRNTDNLVAVKEVIAELKKQKSSHWAEKADRWHEWFKAGVVDKKSGKNMVSVILDEPTAGFDFCGKTEFWDSVFKQTKSNQFIIATHDIRPLFEKNVHIIETEGGYAQSVLEGVKQWQS